MAHPSAQYSETIRLRLPNQPGAFARLAYHPGYHQGQAHLIKTALGFPRAEEA